LHIFLTYKEKNFW